MKDIYRTIPASELFATEVGISGAPLPSNGPGRKIPLIKYLIVGGLIVGAFALAYHLNKKSIPKIIPKKDE
ncbi:MAG: hypothetical protein RJA13_1018 [Bacteroidota bacterium]|jgi:hypothetical protein